MRLNNRRDIEAFMRQRLGCSCPDEVFDSIEVFEDYGLSCGITVDTRLVIGRKLLVFILRVKGGLNLTETVEMLLAEGIKQRDSSELSRFRLVLLGADRNLSSELSGVFQIHSQSDANAHLHMLDI